MELDKHFLFHAYYDKILTTSDERYNE